MSRAYTQEILNLVTSLSCYIICILNVLTSRRLEGSQLNHRYHVLLLILSPKFTDSANTISILISLGTVYVYRHCETIGGSLTNAVTHIIVTL